MEPGRWTLLCQIAWKPATLQSGDIGGQLEIFSYQGASVRKKLWPDKNCHGGRVSAFWDLQFFIKKITSDFRDVSGIELFIVYFAQPKSETSPHRGCYKISILKVERGFYFGPNDSKGDARFFPQTVCHTEGFLRPGANFCPPRFLLRRATENAIPEVKICVSPARNVCWEFFLASRCSAVAILFIRLWLLVNPLHLDRRCVSGGQNLRFACAKHSVGLFSLRRATQNASPELKNCVSPARNAPADLGRTVFPAQGHAKRVLGGQNLRFACAGPQNRMIRMLYDMPPRHGSCRSSWDIYMEDMDLAEVPEIYMDVETWIRRHGSCRGPWDTKMLRHEC